MRFGYHRRDIATSREAGQAAVETALVMPLMVFVVLGLIQLTLLGQAKVLVGYAAFQAARAGVVWSGNVERMQDAALLALLPTLGKTSDLPALGRTYEHARRLSEALAELPWDADAPPVFQGLKTTGLVRVDALSPGGAWEIWNQPRGEELDFDGPEGFPEQTSTPRQLERLFDLRREDPAQDLLRAKTVLSVRVRYWYELRIPFAGWVIFLCWLAARVDVSLHGAIDRSTLDRANALNRRSDVEALPSLAREQVETSGWATLTPGEVRTLWGLARGKTPLEGAKRQRLFVPLSETYSLRMQSNFHRKWSMHPGERR